MQHMTRRLVSLTLAAFAAATLALAPSAFAGPQPSTLQRQNIVDPHVNLLFNVKLKKVSTSSVSFQAKDGSALSTNNVGVIDIGGVAYALNAPKAITLPNQSVFGGTSNDLPVYFYAAAPAVRGGSPALCLSDVGGLTAKGVVATTNTGFVSCPGVTVASTAALRLVGYGVYDTATVLTAAALVDVSSAAQSQLPAIRGTATSSTASTSLVFTATGVTAFMKCIVTPYALGTNVNYIKTVVAGTDQFTAVVDTAQAGSSTSVTYQCQY